MFFSECEEMGEHYVYVISQDDLEALGIILTFHKQYIFPFFSIYCFNLEIYCASEEMISFYYPLKVWNM